MAVVQLRNPTEDRAYSDAKKAAGKTSVEAMRALKRRLSNLATPAWSPIKNDGRWQAREGTRGRLCYPA